MWRTSQFFWEGPWPFPICHNRDSLEELPSLFRGGFKPWFLFGYRAFPEIELDCGVCDWDGEESGYPHHHDALRLVLRKIRWKTDLVRRLYLKTSIFHAHLYHTQKKPEPFEKWGNQGEGRPDALYQQLRLDPRYLPKGVFSWLTGDNLLPEQNLNTENALETGKIVMTERFFGTGFVV